MPQALGRSGAPGRRTGSGEYGDSLGLFEGGGYTAKGMYRPRLDCRMRTNGSPDFCPVCQRAINRMIDYYCGK